MDRIVLTNVTATMVASVTGLLGSATVLLAISGIGECVAPGRGVGQEVMEPSLYNYT